MATQVSLLSGAVASAGSLLLQTNGTTTQATLDTSGNLGLGVTPSAWASSNKAIQVASRSALAQTASFETIVGNNWYYDTGGTNRYLATAASSLYLQGGGAHAWLNAASGTAGNAITFTQAMTLDASGNLGVGTTSPSSYNSGYGSQAVIANTGGSGGITIVSSTSGNGNLYFADGTSGDTQYRGFVAYGHLDDSLRFATAATERARIDSSGNLLVGTTSTSTTNGAVVLGTGSNAYLDVGHASGASSGSYFGAFKYAGSIIGSITQNGTTGVLFNITSDYRLKTVTGAISGHGERIDALEPVEYTWNSDSSVARGFLAHKFQEVYPSSVNGEKDAVDEDGNPKYQTMQASTSEVIADLVAEIKSLRIRIAALEQA